VPRTVVEAGKGQSPQEVGQHDGRSIAAQTGSDLTPPCDTADWLGVEPCSCTVPSLSIPHVIFSLPSGPFLILKMEATCAPETLVPTHKCTANTDTFTTKRTSNLTCPRRFPTKIVCIPCLPILATCSAHLSLLHVTVLIPQRNLCKSRYSPVFKALGPSRTSSFVDQNTPPPRASHF
jgi:hypothetical protein